MQLRFDELTKSPMLSVDIIRLRPLLLSKSCDELLVLPERIDPSILSAAIVGLIESQLASESGEELFLTLGFYPRDLSRRHFCEPSTSWRCFSYGFAMSRRPCTVFPSFDLLSCRWCRLDQTVNAVRVLGTKSYYCLGPPEICWKVFRMIAAGNSTLMSSQLPVFPIFLTTIISIGWVGRLWCCVAFNDCSLLHCSHARDFRLLSLHFEPLLAGIDERCGLVLIKITAASPIRGCVSVPRAMTTMLSMRSSRSTRASRHFTFIVGDFLAPRAMSTARTWIVRRLTLNWARALSMARRSISVTGRCRSHRFRTRVDPEQSSLLAFCPTGTSGATGWVRSRVIAVLVNGVVVESWGDAACRSISAVDAVDEV